MENVCEQLGLNWRVPFVIVAAADLLAPAEGSRSTVSRKQVDFLVWEAREIMRTVHYT